jgi:hypothetical protein
VSFWISLEAMGSASLNLKLSWPGGPTGARQFLARLQFNDWKQPQQLLCTQRGAIEVFIGDGLLDMHASPRCQSLCCRAVTAVMIGGEGVGKVRRHSTGHKSLAGRVHCRAAQLANCPGLRHSQQHPSSTHSHTGRHSRLWASIPPVSASGSSVWQPCMTTN